MQSCSTEYRRAHDAQYVDRDLKLALDLYQGILREPVGTLEHGYSRAQIRNIVSTVVPSRELLEAQVRLAVACLERPESASVRSPVAVGNSRPKML